VEQYAEERTTFYRGFFEGLTARGWAVHVFNLAKSPLFEEHVAPFVSEFVEMDLTRSYQRAWNPLREIVARLQPTVVQGIETIPTFHGVGALRGGRVHPPVVYGRRHNITAGWKHRWMDWMATRGAARVVAVSDAAADIARAEHPRHARKVRAIFSGVDLPEDVHDPSEQAMLDALAADHRFNVLLLSRLRPIKGHDVALRAAGLLKERVPNLRLLFVGDGPDEERLRGIAGELGLGEALTMIPHVEGVGGFLEMADVVIIPSYSDAFPKVGIEAFAKGRAVVASSVGGLVDLIDSGENGLLVPPADPQALAEALARLHEAPDLAAELGRRARACYERGYTLDSMVDAYVELYEELRGLPR